jgi:hypothetical protein
MSELEKTTIEGRVYALRPMPPLHAVAFAPKVATLLASVFSGDLNKLAATYREKDFTAMGAVVLSLLPKISPDQFTSLAKEALAYEVYAGDVKLNAGDHFSVWFNQYPGDMLPVACWAIWSHVKRYFLGSPVGFRAVLLGGASPSLTDTREIT